VLYLELFVKIKPLQYIAFIKKCDNVIMKNVIMKGGDYEKDRDG
jgi:hypothetical protein